METNHLIMTKRAVCKNCAALARDYTDITGKRLSDLLFEYGRIFLCTFNPGTVRVVETSLRTARLYPHIICVTLLKHGTYNYDLEYQFEDRPTN